MSSGEILLLGDINIDTVWPVSEFPGPGRDSFVKSVTAGIGGAVVNSAIVLDGLGQRTGLIACVGKDVWADQVAELLGKTCIDQTYLRVKSDYTTGLIFLVVTPDGERTMYACRGANDHLDIVDIDEEAVQSAKLLHITGYALLKSPQKEAVWRAVELAKKYHVPISLDTGLEPAILNPQGLRRLLPELAICVTGLKETAELFNLSTPKDSADHLLSLGIQLVAIKLGEKGSYVANKKGSYFCPSFSVDAVDTTGAGDSFTAGLLYGWMRGLNLPASAILGNALGALAATVYGAGLSLPGKQSVLDFLRSSQSKTAGIQKISIDEVISVLENDQ